MGSPITCEVTKVHIFCWIAPAIQSIHIFNMFSLTYGASPAVYYYYYYYASMLSNDLNVSTV